TGPAGSHCDVSELVLYRDGEVEETIFVGDAQDADTGQAASIQLDGGNWSGPLREDATFYRRLENTPEDAVGVAVFHLWFLYPDSRYSFAVRYRAPEPVRVDVSRGADAPTTMTLPVTKQWSDAVIDYAPAREYAHARLTTRSRWKGVGQLAIEDVRLVDESGAEAAVFEVKRSLIIEVDVVAREGGIFPLTPAALVFGTNG